MRTLIDSSIPNIELAFPVPFIVTRYHTNDSVKALLANQDTLVCRSTLKIDEALLGNSGIKYVATASSGTDHIDKEYLKDKKIALIDAKGSNAGSVADYVVATLASLKDEGLKLGTKAGIIGLGAVGTEVLACLNALGYTVETFDPLRALNDKHFKSCSLEALQQCSLLCIHPELHDTLPFPSRNLVDAAFLNALKPNTVLINASRGGVVNEFALLNCPTKLIYCTDVYLDEPAINPEIIHYAQICTPHIAGHSIEAKAAVVDEISRKLHQILKLPLPISVKPKQLSVRKFPTKHWEQQVLSIYDPRIETQKLKKAIFNTNHFLDLRKEHRFRHDFLLFKNS